MNLDKYNKKGATHYLRCRHVIGHGVTNYVMDCIPIKEWFVR